MSVNSTQQGPDDAVRHVYVVDDDATIRAELVDALSLRGFATRGFVDGEAFLAEQDDLEPGCLVLDLNLPGVGGIEIQAALSRAGSPHKIVMLTGAGSVSTAVQALHAGAIDFIEKPFPMEGLAKAIGFALVRLRQDRLELLHRQEAEQRVARLTERERDVLAGLVLGLANKIIAYRLGLSPRTVETYRANLMDKLEVKSLSEAIILARDCGLEPSHRILRERSSD
ncbi:response regulator [Sphingomonas sp. 1P06PA]|uniref:response regulator transcription factor n=1 Tax=Sphingomonas sp. 1P06PA TaxID=554121 RepID=UPI0039A6C76F